MLTIHNRLFFSSSDIGHTGGGGFGAAVTYTISAGAISSVTLTNSCFGYTSPPNITITSGVTNTTSLVGGTGYVDVNTQINVSGGGGGGGTVIIPTVASGVITALTITSFGSGYVTTPTITITSGITGTSNVVAGSGYTNGILVYLILFNSFTPSKCVVRDDRYWSLCTPQLWCKEKQKKRPHTHKTQSRTDSAQYSDISGSPALP